MCVHAHRCSGALPPLAYSLRGFSWDLSRCSGHLSLNAVSCLRRGNGKGISNASDLRLDESGDVVVLLLWDLQHNRVQIREELSDSCHNDFLTPISVGSFVFLLFNRIETGEAQDRDWR